MHRILKYSILVVVFITFVNTLVFFGLGIYYSVLSYLEIIHGRIDSHPGIILVESLDRFLIGFVFIIFSIGLSRLFLAESTFLKNYDLPWLKITEFSQIKTLLLSAILVALFVAWAPSAILEAQQSDINWTVILFPSCLLIMAVTAKFIKDLH
jgi:uncharacterized membrane protein YqhA